MTRDDQVFKKSAKDKEGKPIRGAGPAGQCRVPWCTNPGTHPKGRRGLCHTHRVYAHDAITKGVASEKNLIKRGLMLPAKSVNKRKNPSKLKPRVKKTPKKRVNKKKSAKSRVRRRRSRKNPSKPVCVYPKCKTKSHAKGLCKSHYGKAKRRLRGCKTDREKKRLLNDWKRRNLWIEGEKIKARSNPFDLGSKIRGSRRK